MKVLVGYHHDRDRDSDRAVTATFKFSFKLSIQNSSCVNLNQISECGLRLQVRSKLEKRTGEVEIEI